MIESVHIRNFQAHKDTFISFTQGINVISGESDQGKSSVVRAIRWVTKNRPAGFHFRTTGAKGPTSVTLVVNGHSITHYRDDKKHYYMVDNGVELSALRGSVPDEVQSILNFSEYNIHSQLEEPFLMGGDSGAVAKQINDLSGVSVIDKILKETNARIRKEEALEETVSSDIQNTKEQLHNLRNIPTASDILADAEKVLEDLQGYEKGEAELISLLKDIENVKVGPKPFDEIKHFLSCCSEHLEALKKSEKSMASLVACLDDVKEKKGVLKNRSVPESAGPLLEEAQELLSGLREYEVAQEDLVNLLNQIDYTGKKSSVAKMYVQKAKDALAAFKEETKICPTCAKPW